MSDLADFSGPREPNQPATGDLGPALPRLNRPEKAAVILGVLGLEIAGPMLEQMDEVALHAFASAMARLERIPPEVVTATIAEFLAEIGEMEMTVSGGLGRAREMIQDYVTEATLVRILDEAERPSVHNVWQKLSKVDDHALAEFLGREHPQTAAVVLSKMSPEHSARVLALLEPERASEMMLGMTRAAVLEPSVVEAIGLSVSKDFLANQRQGAGRFKPVDRIGAIMNFTPGSVRSPILGFLEGRAPDLLAQIRSKMFTFQDIATRIEKRDASAVVRAVDGEVLLKALAGAADNAPETREFLLSSISSRVAEQLRADLAEMGNVKVREAEEAQTAILMAIRDLENAGELKLIEPEA